MQQFSFIDLFIVVFESALRVSGTNSPIFRNTFDRTCSFGTIITKSN